MVVVNVRSNDMSVLLGKGDGSLADAKSSGLGLTSAPTSLVLADLNRDGRLDAVAAHGEIHTLSVSYGNEDGTFQPPWHLTIADPIRSLAVADVNGDGELDIAMTTANSVVGGRVHVFLGTSCGK